MSSSILNDTLNSARQFLDDVGIGLNSLTIAFTLFVAIFPPLVLLILAFTQHEAPSPPVPGCRKLGINGPSNLSDQYSMKYSEGSEASTKPWNVKAIFIYPLKSCMGIELGTSEIVRTGLKYDRQFTLGQQVTGLPTMEGKVKSEWNFITQRTFPRLAKVETEIWVPCEKAPGYSEEAEYVKSEGCLVVRFPFSPDTDFTVEGLKAYGRIWAAYLSGKPEPMLEFRVPFNPSQERIKKIGYRSAEVKIWKDTPVALDMAREISVEIMEKLRYTLGVTNPITLFRIDTRKYREVFKCAPKKEDVGFQPIIGMADSVCKPCLRHISQLQD
jgi:hypothetical protein